MSIRGVSLLSIFLTLGLSLSSFASEQQVPSVLTKIEGTNSKYLRCDIGTPESPKLFCLSQKLVERCIRDSVGEPVNCSFQGTAAKSFQNGLSVFFSTMGGNSTMKFSDSNTASVFVRTPLAAYSLPGMFSVSIFLSSKLYSASCHVYDSHEEFEACAE